MIPECSFVYKIMNVLRCDTTYCNILRPRMPFLCAPFHSLITDKTADSCSGMDRRTERWMGGLNYRLPSQKQSCNLDLIKQVG